MRKVFCYFLSAIFCLSLAACGGTAANSKPKKSLERKEPSDSYEESAELKGQYDFYEKSVAEIRTKMKVTPKQADEIFLVLLSIGVDGEATISKSFETDNTYSIYWVDAYDSCEVDIVDGVVTESRNEEFGDNVLYPLDRATATVNKAAIGDVVASIEALSSDSSLVDYESAQAAFDFLTENLKKQVPKEQVTKLFSFYSRFTSIEESVDAAIEKARAEKDRVSINDDLGTGSGNIVLIYLKGKDSLTNKMTKAGMLIEAFEILQYLQPREDISEITIFWSFSLVDSFGNSKEDTVMKVNFDNATLSNINFENFDRNKIPNIANDYFEHTALSK